MQNPSEHHKLTSDNNTIKFKKPVHDPFNFTMSKSTSQLFLNSDAIINRATAKTEVQRQYFQDGGALVFGL